MDKKLEARISKLERMIGRKNEQRSRKESEMSPAEIEAYIAVKNAIKALANAEKMCNSLEDDDMWGYDDWYKLGRACEIALSYLPDVYTF